MTDDSLLHVSDVGIELDAYAGQRLLELLEVLGRRHDVARAALERVPPEVEGRGRGLHGAQRGRLGGRQRRGAEHHVAGRAGKGTSR